MLVDVTIDLSYFCIAPWIRMGVHNDGHVVLNKMEFDRLLLNDAPLLTLLVYTACQTSNPQPFNSCLQRAMTHIDCMPLWKGDILLLKYNCEEQLLANVSYADVSLCHVLLQIAIVCGVTVHLLYHGIFLFSVLHRTHLLFGMYFYDWIHTLILLSSLNSSFIEL